MRRVGLALTVVLAGACQSYNLEAVDPQTVIAVETSGTFTSAKAPLLLIVQDRSGSMNACFGAPIEPGSEHRCDNNQRSNNLEVDGRLTRMEAAANVLSAVVEDNQSGVYFGLSVYGTARFGDDACTPSEVLVEPGPDTAPQVIAAYAENPGLVVENPAQNPLETGPYGGTPTTVALAEAYSALVDDEGKLRQPDRANYVVLVTDGLMNCNTEFPEDDVCICPEKSCPNTGGGETPFGEVVPNPQDPVFCLDLDASIAEVNQLREALVPTFVIGLGEGLQGAVAETVLNELAIAGGVARDGAVKFFPAGDPATLESSLREIVRTITAPCTYDLDGAVCDGRLVSISLSVKDSDVAEPRVIATTCDPALGANSWFFDAGNPSRLAFDPALCRELEDATEVKISIKGVQNDCAVDQVPSCGPVAAP